MKNKLYSFNNASDDGIDIYLADRYFLTLCKNEAVKSSKVLLKQEDTDIPLKIFKEKLNSTFNLNYQSWEISQNRYNCAIKDTNGKVLLNIVLKTTQDKWTISILNTVRKKEWDLLAKGVVSEDIKQVILKLVG